MMTHRLKILPAPFAAVRDGTKTHEIRSIKDRQFKVGDVLILREWNPGTESYTRRKCEVLVTYMSEWPVWGLPTDIVVMSIVKISRERA